MILSPENALSYGHGTRSLMHTVSKNEWIRGLLSPCCLQALLPTRHLLGSFAWTDVAPMQVKVLGIRESSSWTTAPARMIRCYVASFSYSADVWLILRSRFALFIAHFLANFCDFWWSGQCRAQFVMIEGKRVGDFACSTSEPKYKLQCLLSWHQGLCRALVEDCHPLHR